MSSGTNLTCFKAYDVRGKLGEELDEDIAYRIGRATAQSQKAKIVVVGFDARATSPDLADAVGKGIYDAGADVLEIGLTGTEEVYAAVSEFSACAGIEVTASHNPIDYNGMKIVGRGSKPLSDNEFLLLKNWLKVTVLSGLKTGCYHQKRVSPHCLRRKSVGFCGLFRP